MVVSMDRWIGKVAVVSGASSGIGAAIVEKLVGTGLVVVGLARRLERMQELGRKLANKKGTFHPFQCDMSKECDILKAFEFAKKLGPIHVLVNNAGVVRSGSMLDQPTEEWQETIAVNLLGLCIATREAVKDMKKNNVDGHIIHINSITGHRVIDMPGLSIYPATKFGVTVLTEQVRREINTAKLKIKITSVSPGVVMTEIFEAGGMTTDPKKMDKLPALNPEDIADGIIYALSTPPHVNISELTIKPVNEEM